jgi:hypothetical protein
VFGDGEIIVIIPVAIGLGKIEGTGYMYEFIDLGCLIKAFIYAGLDECQE